MSVWRCPAGKEGGAMEADWPQRSGYNARKRSWRGGCGVRKAVWVAGAVCLATSLCGASGAIAASPAIPTCTVTKFELIGIGTRGINPGSGTEFGMGTNTAECFGTYVVHGVVPEKLGYTATTTDNYAELAAVLKRMPSDWRMVDGVPAVSVWVNLSPRVAAGMKKAGVNPTMFLQWVNDANASAWAGTGVRVPDGSPPPVWPSWLPKAYVAQPAAIAGGQADTAIKPPREGVLGVVTSKTKVATVVPPAKQPVQASSGVSRSTRASSTKTATAKASSTKTTKKPAAITTKAPPAAVMVQDRTLPCVAEQSCAAKVKAYDRWRALPWYRKALWEIRWQLWEEIAGIAVLGGGIAGLRVWQITRRNIRWYGKRWPKF